MMSMILIGAIVWNIPPPAGIEVRAMHLLAIFVSTVGTTLNLCQYLLQFETVVLMKSVSDTCELVRQVY